LRIWIRVSRQVHIMAGLAQITDRTIRAKRRDAVARHAGVDWRLAILVVVGLSGGVMSVVVGELVSSGAVHDLISGYQAAGSQMGGAFNNVSQGEQDVLRRSLAMAVWSHLSA
jgi:hypothetical protein